MSKILVTKTFLPPIEEYKGMLEKVWESAWITNNGPYATQLERELEKFLNVPNVVFLNNGTIAIQLAIKALALQGEVITTPFSFVATTSCVVWENCTPTFVDINPETNCIDAAKIEACITEKTSAILATNVFGNVCDFEAIQKIADKHKLKVIYDSAHAFNVKDNNGSVLNYGDISTLSFHATKVFHTIEGGAIVTKDSELANKIRLMRNFGIAGPEEIRELGINGKNSEFHAAMGVLNLKYYNENTAKRKQIWEFYFDNLKDSLQLLKLPIDNFQYNYSYFPIILKSEAELHKVVAALNNEEIYPRRYFYPSLNKLPYVKRSACPVSESVAERILCLPLYHDLDLTIVKQVIEVINHTI